MKKETKIILITIIFIIIALATIIAYNILDTYLFHNSSQTTQSLGFHKDIIITETSSNQSSDYGGYATSSTYTYYIDLTQKKLYEEEYYYVYSPIASDDKKGSQRSIKREKNLTDDEINEVIQLTKTGTSKNNSDTKSTYYTIRYNGKYINIDGENYSKLSKILY